MGSRPLLLLVGSTANIAEPVGTKAPHQRRVSRGERRRAALRNADAVRNRTKSMCIDSSMRAREIAADSRSLRGSSTCDRLDELETRSPDARGARPIRKPRPASSRRVVSATVESGGARPGSPWSHVARCGRASHPLRDRRRSRSRGCCQRPRLLGERPPSARARQAGLRQDTSGLRGGGPCRAAV